MIQDLITFLLIAFSAAITLVSFYRIVVSSKKGGKMGCAGCSGCQVKKVTVSNALLPEFNRTDLIHHVQNMRLPAK